MKISISTKLFLAVLSTVQTPVAGRPVELRFGVAQSGLPVSDFEPLSAGPGHCLLIALTGYGHAEARQRTQEAGFDEHLTKPAQQAELQRVLEEAGRGKI